MSDTNALRFGPSLDPHVEPADEVTVEVGGRSLRGWKAISITRRMDSASGSFDLQIQHVEPWPVRAGSEVRVLIGETLVVTGFVDEINATLEPTSTSLSVSGRDRTEDLVDCAVPETPMELRNVVLGDIARHVCAPLSIEVTDPFGSGDLFAAGFDVFRFSPGENSWAAIERACRMRGKLAHADERGRLVLSEAGIARASTELVYGGPVIKRAELRWTQSERFRLYVVTGQGKGTDDRWGSAVAEIRGEARDLDVERPRTFVRVADGAVDQATCQAYAQWLATVRAARAATISLECFGWRQTPGGRLWAVNELVPVTIPRWRLRGELLLVNAVRFNYPPRTTTLELVRKDAYTLEPELDREDDPMRAWADDDEAPDLEELDES